MNPDHSNDSIWVVIPTYNRADDLIECLDSLREAGLNMNRIVVVDNASEDDSVKKMSQHYPQVELILLENNIGATGGSNAGFSFALEQGAEYVLRMDSDVVVARDFLAPLMEVAESDSRIGVIGPKIYYFDNPKEIWYAGVDKKDTMFGTTDGCRHQLDAPDNSHLREVDYVWGATMLIRGDLLQVTGGFDTDFFIYYEEHDFCDRVSELGYKLMFVPTSLVWHKVGSESHNAWTAFQWNKSKMVFFRKHAKGIFQQIFFVVYAFLFAFGDSLLNALKLRNKVGNRGPLKHALRGLWAGLIMPLSEPQRKP